jgi:pimeloyl-ACP methyl ester carboxylesterase
MPDQPPADHPGGVDRHDGLAVHRRGPHGAPRVVLVHGAMDRAGGFVKVLRHLRHLDVVRYDRRGYAGSRTGPVHEDFTAHVDDLFTVLDGEPATVVGHSLGGVVALAAAQRRPDLVRSVGAFEAPLVWRPLWPDAPGGTGDDDEPEAVAERFLRRILGDHVWERLPPAMQRDRRSEGRALVAEVRALKDAGSLVAPAEIVVPVLAGYGSESSARHVGSARTLAEEAPRGELRVIDGAGHAAHYTHATDFAAFIERAVARAGEGA